jgi:hypothetical protein
MRHGVPYIEESVFRRFAQLWSIMMGDSSMLRADTRPPSADQDAPATPLPPRRHLAASDRDALPRPPK